MKVKLTSIMLFIILSITNNIHAKKLDLFILDADRLAKDKANITRNTNTNTNTIQVFFERADSELTKKNITVTDKPITPASGDKRDYMSLGRYWWPNPDTKDGLPYIRKDGVSNPELKKFDREKLGSLPGRVMTLCKAYYFSGEKKYAEKAVSILETWFLDDKTKMNPNMNFGQTIPGHNNGKGRAEGIIDTYSFIPLVDAMLLLEYCDGISKENMKNIREWFAQYVQWLITDDIGIAEMNAKNNHSVAYDVQLAIFASFAGNEELSRKTIYEFPSKRIFKQVMPDGSQPYELARTTAMGYSIFNINHMLDMCSVAKRIGYDLYSVKNSDGRCIDAAISFLLKYHGKKVSEFPYKQISDWDKTQKDLVDLARRASQYDKQFKFKDNSNN